MWWFDYQQFSNLLNGLITVLLLTGFVRLNRATGEDGFESPLVRYRNTGVYRQALALGLRGAVKAVCTAPEPCGIGHCEINLPWKL